MPIVTGPDREAREAAPAEKWLRQRAGEVQQETAAMHTAFVALHPLDGNAQRRVLRWLKDALENIEVPF